MSCRPRPRLLAGSLPAAVWPHRWLTPSRERFRRARRPLWVGRPWRGLRPVRRASRPSFRLRAAATVTEDRGPVTFWIDDRTFEIPSSDRDALLRRAKQLPHGLLGDLC